MGHRVTPAVAEAFHVWRFVDSNCHNYKLICPGQLRVCSGLVWSALPCRVAKSTDLSDIYARRETSEREREGESERVSESAFNGASDKRRLSDKCVAWTLR